MRNAKKAAMAQGARQEIGPNSKFSESVDFLIECFPSEAESSALCQAELIVRVIVATPGFQVWMRSFAEVFQGTGSICLKGTRVSARQRSLCNFCWKVRSAAKRVFILRFRRRKMN